ncbi:MAG TPA: hypothetical protein VFB20_01775 [Burkholderiales bacterium]|nr:hypothetical protein [Burkholderiales bacterium]
MKRCLLPLVLLVSFFALPAPAAESGYTIRPTELKAKPFTDAQTVATLPEGAQVEIIVRKSAWMQVRAGNRSDTVRPEGWVRMLSLRLGDPNRRPTGGGILAAIGVGARQPPQTGATVTTGVRGFSEEDLKQAKPNPAELKKMESFSASAAQAAQLAEAGKLAPRDVPYFAADGKPLEKNK